MLTTEDKGQLHAMLAAARDALDHIERDVDNTGARIVSTGAVVGVVQLSREVTKLTLKIGREWGDGA